MPERRFGNYSKPRDVQGAPRKVRFNEIILEPQQRHTATSLAKRIQATFTIGYTTEPPAQKGKEGGKDWVTNSREVSIREIKQRRTAKYVSKPEINGIRAQLNQLDNDVLLAVVGNIKMTRRPDLANLLRDLGIAHLSDKVLI